MAKRNLIEEYQGPLRFVQGVKRVLTQPFVPRAPSNPVGMPRWNDPGVRVSEPAVPEPAATADDMGFQRVGNLMRSITPGDDMSAFVPEPAVPRAPEPRQVANKKRVMPSASKTAGVAGPVSASGVTGDAGEWNPAMRSKLLKPGQFFASGPAGTMTNITGAAKFAPQGSRMLGNAPRDTIDRLPTMLGGGGATTGAYAQNPQARARMRADWEAKYGAGSDRYKSQSERTISQNQAGAERMARIQTAPKPLQYQIVRGPDGQPMMLTPQGVSPMPESEAQKDAASARTIKQEQAKMETAQQAQTREYALRIELARIQNPRATPQELDAAVKREMQVNEARAASEARYREPARPFPLQGGDDEFGFRQPSVVFDPNTGRFMQPPVFDGRGPLLNPGQEQGNEVIRDVNGKKAVFDSSTKKFIRWA